MQQATPAKLKDGTWGARVAGAAAVGDEVTVTTKSGKSWQARVTRVLWSGDGATLCATASCDRPSGARSTRGRGSGRCAECGRSCSPRYETCYDCSACELCGRNKYTCGHCIGW